MQITKPLNTSELGQQFAGSLSIPDEKLDFLFTALFLTLMGVFIGGNILLLDVSVLQSSARIALICLAVLLIFYTLSRSIGSVTWGLVLTYGLMWIVVYSRQAWLIQLVFIIALAALAYVAMFLRVSRSQWISVLLMAIIATAVILGVTRAYTSFDMLNRLYVGYVEQDTLFHASIAAMIKNYGVISTGLHGLVETPNHVLSHVLFASISKMSGAGVIEVYGVANTVLFSPILIFSAVVCAVSLDRSNQLNIPLTWGIVCILLTLIPFLLQYWGVFQSFFISESYLVSLGLFLLGLPLLFKRQLSSLDLVLILILTVQISNAKSSVGLIFAGLWLVRVLFVRGERIRQDVAALALSTLAAAWVTFDAAEANQGSIEIFPFHFIGQNSFLGGHVIAVGTALIDGQGLSFASIPLSLLAILSFLVFHFLLSWIIVARGTYKRGVVAVFSSPYSVFSLAAILGGVVIVFFFAIPTGSAQYFSNVAFFVALPGVAALLAFAFSKRFVPPTLLLILGILLICLVNVKGFYRASALHPMRSAPQNSALINSLAQLRQSAPVNVVMQYDDQIVVNNPVTRCTAQPFVFPAVSERPWVDAIAIREDCTYRYYSYGQYGITDSQQTVTVQPQFLPGMMTLRLPDSITDIQSSD